MIPIPPKRKLPPPPRKKLFKHFVFDRVHLYPNQRPMPKPRPLPFDEEKFCNDSIRPYPAWPLICRVSHLMSFVDEKAIKSWMEKNCPTVSLKKTWKCEACGMFHFDSWPIEITGNSSGKSKRKDDEKQRDAFKLK